MAIDPATAPIVQRIFDQVATGGSARQVALSLTREGVPTPTGRGVAWHVSTIRGILIHPVYAGDARAFRWAKTKRRGKHQQRLKPDDQHVALQNAAPELVSPTIAAAAQAQLALNMKQATRNNRRPTEALLRAGYARCGYCGNSLAVSNRTLESYYRCNTASRDTHDCPAAGIKVQELDNAVWNRVEQVLSDPGVIANRVAQLQINDPTQDNLAALGIRIKDIERQRGNLMRRVATIDEDDFAAPFLVEIKTQGEQLIRLRQERAGLLAERAGWEVARTRLDDLAWWCQVQADNLARLSYEQKRLALLALGVEVSVWAKDHAPRYTITLRIDLESPVNDLRLGFGDDHGEVHVGASIRRGYARRAGRRAGRP